MHQSQQWHAAFDLGHHRLALLGVVAASDPGLPALGPGAQLAKGVNRSPRTWYAAGAGFRPGSSHR